LMAYNKLKMSRFFYKLFSEFDFLLTYELDAFIFKDDLQYWCSKGYDYIGAPWFEGLDNPVANAKLIGVGNSGFSLRNIDSVQSVLESIFYKNPKNYNTGRRESLKAHMKLPYQWLRNKLGENYTVQKSGLYEDRFFSEVVPLFVKNFKIASAEDALKFSFEVNPARLYEMNAKQLPTGCHAWWRYDLEFWRPFIMEQGYEL